MLKKAYIEISNHCNLSCAFCPKTTRPPRTMSDGEFAVIADKLRGHVQYLYLHVMGEPLLHPQLSEILRLGGEKGFRICITTNGTLLAQRRSLLLSSPALHKVSVSLHSFEGNNRCVAMDAYLSQVWDFCDAAARQGIICALRLWNEGGLEQRNGEILAFLQEKTGQADWAELRSGSRRLRDHLYLENAQRFDWPDLHAPARAAQFCYALRDQIGVLADGTVVPCCLDHEGDIPLGNLLQQELAEILAGERARALFDGFSCRRPAEELCRRCGYAVRFNR